jgi:hypothetical protein
VYGPAFDGENSILGIHATYEAEIATVRDGQSGWYCLGSIRMMSGGEGLGGGGSFSGGSGRFGAPT